MNFFLVLQLISNPEVHNYMEDCHRKHNSVQLLGLSIEQTTPEWNPVFAVHFPSGWGRHSFMPQLSLLPYGPALTRWASPDRHHLGWSFIQRILSCLWDSKTKLMSVGAADAELPLQAKPMPAFVKAGEWGRPLQCHGETMPSTSYLVSLGGEGERSPLYSWLLMGGTVSSRREVGQKGSRVAGSGQLAPGWWQHAWEGRSLGPCQRVWEESSYRWC